MAGVIMIGGGVCFFGAWLAYSVGYRQGRDHFDMERKYEQEIKKRRIGR